MLSPRSALGHATYERHRPERTLIYPLVKHYPALVNQLAQQGKNPCPAMSLSELGSLGAFIGSIAVLITLVMRVFQIKSGAAEVVAAMGSAVHVAPRIAVL